MKKIISVLISLVLICGLTFSLTAYAYNKPVSTVSASSSSVVVGTNVTFTVKHSASDGKIGALDYVVYYDASLLEYVSSDGPAMVNGAGGAVAASWYDVKGASEVVVKLTFKTLAAGKPEVKVQTTTFADEAALEFPLPNDSATSVTILNSQPKSTNANLKSVAFSLGGTKGKATISPAFSSAVTSYTVTVPNDTTSASIEAIVADTGKATTKIEGSWAAVTGDWVRKVVVTAEDGVTKKVYSFKIVKGTASETPTPTPSTPETNEDLRVVVGNKEFTIVTDLSEIETPVGLKKDIVKYNDVEIPCLISKDKSYTFVYLSDGENVSLYSYDASHISFEKCEISEIGAGNYIIFDAGKYTDEVKDLSSKEVEIGNKKVKGYCFNQSGDYVLIWAIGADGEGKLYVYDAVEKTLQRYGKVHSSPQGETDTTPIVTPSPDDETQQEFPFDLQIVILVFAVLVIIILILLIAWIAALVRLKRAVPKKQEIPFVPFFEDENIFNEFNGDVVFVEESRETAAEENVEECDSQEEPQEPQEVQETEESEQETEESEQEEVQETEESSKNEEDK